MDCNRSRYGLTISAFGAIVLAVSVFLPWYGLSLSGEGAGAAAQLGLHGALTGRHVLGDLSGTTALHGLSVLLLALAGLAIFDALVPMLGGHGMLPAGAGRSVVLLGCLACVCVVFRMIVPPAGAGGVFSVSVREGAWFALLGALAMVIGGLWPRYQLVTSGSEGRPADAFSLLMGWATEA